MDDGAVGLRDVDEGWDGVVLGCRLCGGGGRWGEGGSGCGGWGVLVWVRVWVRAGSLELPSLPLWCWGLCGVVLVVVLSHVVLVFRFRFRFGVGFWVGVRFEVEKDLVPEVRGHWCRVRGVPGVLPGCLGSLCGVGGPPVALSGAAALALAVALWMRSAGRGGFRRMRWRMSMRMRTRRKWWFWETRFAL